MFETPLFDVKHLKTLDRNEQIVPLKDMGKIDIRFVTADGAEHDSTFMMRQMRDHLNQEITRALRVESSRMFGIR